MLSHSDRRKTSSKSEGAAIDSRKVSFIDELTGMSARSDPKFEEQLQQQLKIVKEAGELGEFVQNSKPNSSAAAATSTISSNEVVERREENINDNLPDTNEEKEKKIRNLK